MEKKYWVICFIIFWTNSLFAQKDSGFFKNVIIKINPTLLLPVVVGEQGGIVQFPLIKKAVSPVPYYKVDGFLGVGYNEYYPQGEAYASGYTIRGGIYYFFTKRRKGYVQLQYFFRKWFFNNCIAYPIGANTVLEPFSIIGSQLGSPDYNYNAIVTINCLDLIYGNEVPLFNSKHFIFEWYIGIGYRFKNIQQVITGNYHDNQYYPNTTPVGYHWLDNYPDFKLGFMIGYKL